MWFWWWVGLERVVIRDRISPDGGGICICVLFILLLWKMDVRVAR